MTRAEFENMKAGDFVKVRKTGKIGEVVIKSKNDCQVAFETNPIFVVDYDLNVRNSVRSISNIDIYKMNWLRKLIWRLKSSRSGKEKYNEWEKEIHN